jgi:hypothetical protein
MSRDESQDEAGSRQAETRLEAIKRFVNVEGSFCGRTQTAIELKTHGQILEITNR